MKAAAILKRIFEYALILFIIITINFLLTHYMPGDPILHLIGEEEYYNLMASNPQVIEEMREKYGLNKSTLEQYWIYLKTTVTLNFGYSYIYKQPVLDVLLFRMKWTLMLLIPSVIISAFLGAFLGIKAGWKPGSQFDILTTPLMLLINTTPTYCISIFVLTFFSFTMGFFPFGGMTSGGLSGLDKALDIIWHMFLPLMILVISKTSYNYFIMKSSVIEISEEDYILTATSKGLSDRNVLSKHILKNALLPYITVVCMQLGFSVAGTMLVEVVFSWKGMGTLIHRSVQVKDFPMLQLSFLFISICVIISNIISDLLYIIVDPRVKEGDSYGQ